MTRTDRLDRARRALIVDSEAIQREAWRTFASAPAPDFAAAFGIRVEERHGELYQAARGIPGFQYNKVFSFGIAAEITEDRLDSAKDWIAGHCPPGTALAIPPVEQPPALDEWLHRRNFRRHPLEVAVFTLGADARPALSTSPAIEVRTASPDEGPTVGRVLCEGFGNPPGSAAGLAALVGRPGLTAYVAYEGSNPLGAAAMFTAGDQAWLFIAAVRPDARNRGAQTALLARRIADGRAAGIRVFHVAAYRPVPGHDDVFSSYRNLQRAGFELAYVRPNYILSG